jgi:hypothetical protein
MERTLQGPSEGVAVQAELRDVLVWSLQNKESLVNISFRSFETAAASKKIEYLASLVHRTTVLADDLALGFVSADQRYDNRLRYLAWYLTNVQEEYTDPAFLTKASYALRAARDHLRSHDSWKIISRFRYTWQCLPSDKEVCAEECWLPRERRGEYHRNVGPVANMGLGSRRKEPCYENAVWASCRQPTDTGLCTTIPRY